MISGRNRKQELKLRAISRYYYPAFYKAKTYLHIN